LRYIKKFRGAGQSDDNNKENFNPTTDSNASFALPEQKAFDYNKEFKAL